MKEKIETRRFYRNDSRLEVEVVAIEKLKRIGRVVLSKPHRTDFHHVFLVENACTHYVDFKKIKIQPYSLLFIAKGKVHAFDPSIKLQGRIIIFTEHVFSVSESDVSFLKNTPLFDSLYEIFTIPLSKVLFAKFSTICEDIREESDSNAMRSEPVLVKNLLQNFLIIAERTLRDQGFREKRKDADWDEVVRFRELLENRFTEHKTVFEYADEMGIGLKKLERLTMRILGKSPKAIVHERLLLEAKRLLAYTNRSVKEIAHHLGFDDPSYFVRYFKRFANITPLEF
ncbi:MAG TPA: AraC family transcriptional regulator, partial [bacterium]|nr:AraC family transcriptional regulator [bacterium]